MDKQRKVGLLTSGGDAPGMNAAIRAIVRTAVNRGVRVIGVKRGYEGLLSADIMEMTGKNVSEIINHGGTILLTARSQEMMTEAGMEKAAQVCKILGLDALIVIGGDGSLHGAQELANRGVNVIGIPGTIDLDLNCTDYTIGFDTAVNTGMEAINKIRDTSSSHERCSVVELMGHNAGFIALWCGVAGAAEDVIIAERFPDRTVDTDEIIRRIIENRSKGKTHNLILIAEGLGGSVALSHQIQDATGIESRGTVLGHLQRGGSPTALDRMHASLMGYHAVEAFLRGEKNRIIVYRKGDYLSIDIDEGLAMERPYDNSLYEIIRLLSI